jgi:hypothetical protein
VCAVLCCRMCVCLCVWHTVCVAPWQANAITLLARCLRRLCLCDVCGVARWRGARAVSSTCAQSTTGIPLCVGVRCGTRPARLRCITCCVIAVGKRCWLPPCRCRVGCGGCMLRGSHRHTQALADSARVVAHTPCTVRMPAIHMGTLCQQAGTLCMPLKCLRARAAPRSIIHRL